MSDLISRSELLKELKSLKIVLNGKQIFSDDAKDTVLRIVNEQPTAYDIDKVVEELDRARTNNGGLKFEFIPFDKVAEIVKQGSVHDDVCEWKYDKHFEFAKSKCGSIDTHRIEFKKLKYCPYCGKKIKAVE